MKKKIMEEPTEIEMPLDIALSLLRPNELEKLKKYVLAYLTKHGNEEQKKDVALPS
jgi:hypothetical protein